MIEIKRPGSEEWESREQLGGKVPLTDVVGSLVRYPSGIVCKVTGLSEPNSDGIRQLQMEINGVTEGESCG